MEITPTFVFNMSCLGGILGIAVYGATVNADMTNVITILATAMGVGNVVKSTTA